MGELENDVEARLRRRRERISRGRRGSDGSPGKKVGSGTFHGNSTEEEDESLQVRIKWESGKRSGSNVTEDVDETVCHFKEEGNAYFQEGNVDMAIACYRKALEVARASGTDTPRAEARLHSNLAAVYIKAKQYEEACEHSEIAIGLDPTWSKPLYRLAQAQMELGLYRGAMLACRRGEAILEANKDNSREFSPLMDKIAYVAALNGSLAGFDGRVLEVRSAGEEAWLGREAPEDPFLDRKKEVLAIDAMGMPVKSNEKSEDGTGCGEIVERYSFRSLREAMEEAKDGDRILLLRGIHNGCGRSVNVNKRVLIRGEGTMQETTYDQRANVPTLRMTCTAVVQNLDFDMSGFRECILVDGDQTARPIFEHCSIKCSGDNGVYTSGFSHAIFRDCKITGRKSGLCSIDSSCPSLFNCTLSSSGFQAVLCMDESHPKLKRCVLKENEEEGVVVMDGAQISLTSCQIRSNKGPGIDISASGRALLVDTTIEDNIGGVWIWESGFAVLHRSTVNGGRSHAVLVDGEGMFDAKESAIHGIVHASEPSWNNFRKGNNILLELENPTELPPEEGCFKFDPDPYTRKQ